MARLRPFSALAALVLTLGIVALPTCGRRGRARQDPSSSVLLITIDTLRADAVGAYGSRTGATPTIDRLAASGVRFETAHAHNVVTLPSHANILSGRHPLDHGVRDNSGFRFPPGVETLATLLGARGLRTGAFVSAFPLDSRFGLARGFDVYDDRFGDPESQTAFHMQERRGPDTVAAARKWLDVQGGARTFCWVHVYEPHFPYEPPEPLASRFAGEPYTGEVAAADDALRPLLEPLLAAGRAARTLVVVTADHGESLGEHGEPTHGIFAYEATLRVPLILYEPGLLRPGVVTEPVRHVDVLPTILEALAIPLPADLPGRSLMARIRSEQEASSTKTNYFEALSASLNRGWAPLRGVMDGPFKYVDLPIPELYDLASDPHETRNLAASEPQRLERMRLFLGEIRRGDRGARRAPESAEIRERLKSLGYVTSTSTTSKEHTTPEDDPKQLIELDRALQEVITRYKSGDLKGALELCLEVVKRRPEMPLSLVNLGFLRHEAGDLAGAIEAVKKAVSLSPEEGEVVALLGVYLNEASRAGEAISLLAPFAARGEPDLDILTAYGMALAMRGRPRESLASFERIRQIDPSNAMALVNIGTVHLMTTDYGSARTAFDQALALDPRTARAHNSLGVIAARQGHMEEAIERWKQAVALDPHDYQTLFNLGTALARLGQDAEARSYLEAYVREAPRATEARGIEQVRAWLGRTSRRGS